MELSDMSHHDDEIVEPIEEAVVCFEEYLEQLQEYLSEFGSLQEEATVAGAPDLETDSHGREHQQDCQQNHFHEPVSIPKPNSLIFFNLIISKINTQILSINDAMGAHTIFKISTRPSTPSTNPDKRENATAAELFEIICPRLEIGNLFHLPFKRVGKASLEGINRLRELNEEWKALWDGGLKEEEGVGVTIAARAVERAVNGLEEVMLGQLKTIHTFHVGMGW